MNKIVRFPLEIKTQNLYFNSTSSKSTVNLFRQFVYTDNAV